MIVPATRLIICLTELSRWGLPSWPRKYFWATMFVAFCDQLFGNSTPALLERDVIPVADVRVPQLPLHRLEGVRTRTAQKPLDLERLTGDCLRGACGVRSFVHRTFLLCCACVRATHSKAV